MNLEPLIEQIVNSEDPVASFSKIASDLDDRWKITLAREVNKNLFGKELAESPLNAHVNFDVIQVPKMDKIASVANSNKSIEKTASQKAKNITPDMFMFIDNNNYHNTTTYYQPDKLVKEARELDEKKEIEKEFEQRDKLIKQAEEALKFFIEEEKEIRYKDIAKSINNEEELKSFTKIALELNMEHVAKKVIELYEPDLKFFQKVASATLTFSKKASFEKELQELEYLEKTALNKLRKIVIDKIVTGIGKGVNGVGRASSSVLHIPTIIGAAAKNGGKFIFKHPIVTTAAVGGIVASSNFDKNTYDTLQGR